MFLVEILEKKTANFLEKIRKFSYVTKLLKTLLTTLFWVCEVAQYTHAHFSRYTNEKFSWHSNIRLAATVNKGTTMQAPDMQRCIREDLNKMRYSCSWPTQKTTMGNMNL